MPGSPALNHTTPILTHLQLIYLKILSLKQKENRLVDWVGFNHHNSKEVRLKTGIYHVDTVYHQVTFGGILKDFFVLSLQLYYRVI